MTDWWNSLSGVLQVLHLIAFLATGIVLVQTVLLVTGSGMDDFTTGDVDHGGPGDHAAGLSVLSLRTITAFFAGFGWTGVVVLKEGGSILLAVLLATAVGVALAAAIIWLMRSMRRLAHSGSVDYANAVGQVATVAVTIQPHAAAGGQVEVMVQGRLATVAAISRGAVPIPIGAKVTVAELADRRTLIIVPF